MSLMSRFMSVLFAAVAVLVGLPALFGFVTGFEATDGGHVGLVRNGGWFDDTSIRQVLPANSSRTYVGMWSSVHPYPVSERFYDIIPAGNDTQTSAAYRTPTRDGVDVGLTARFNFKLNTDSEVIKAFDNAFGVRQFAGADGNAYYPYEGDVGFEAFLSTIAKPVIESTIRQQVGDVSCADLYSSCALVQNPNAQIDPNAGVNSAVIQRIQEAIDKAFADNVNAQLGGQYFTAVRVSITGVDLNSKIRDQITNAQAARAGVSVSQADAARAAADAAANVNKQAGYNACPTCAVLDEIRAQGEALSRLPGSVTVYAPGGGAGINVGVPAK